MALRRPDKGPELITPFLRTLKRQPSGNTREGGGQGGGGSSYAASDGIAICLWYSQKMILKRS